MLHHQRHIVRFRDRGTDQRRLQRARIAQPACTHTAVIDVAPVVIMRLGRGRSEVQQLFLVTSAKRRASQPSTLF